MEMNAPGLLDHLRLFFHYTAPTSLVQICVSAGYLLVHAPATRSAAFDYLGTFYKISAFLQIKQNLEQRNANAREQTELQQNLVQISACIKAVQESIESILESSEGNDSWPVKLSEWLVDLLGFISSFSSYLDPSRLTLDEVNFLKSMSTYDAIEYWKNQCKTTMDILKLIQKCFQLASDEARWTMIDFIYLTSSKYGTSFDWFLCELSALYPQDMFDKFLQVSFTELNEANSKLKRASFVQFFSTNFAAVVKNGTMLFLDDMSAEGVRGSKSAMIFLFRLLSKSPPMMSVMLNEALCWNGEYTEHIFSLFRQCLAENDAKFTSSLVDCLKQIKNPAAVFDLSSNLINWMTSYAKFDEINFVTPVYKIIVSF